MEFDPEDANRRRFLKRSVVDGSAGLGVAAATGPSAARTDPVPQERVERLLDAHADVTLSALEADGVIADREDLPTGTAIDFGGVVAGTPGAAKVLVPDHPPELRVVASVAQGMLTISVRPGHDDATAVLDAEDGRFAYDDERGWYDFDAAASCDCTFTRCPDAPAYLEACCSGPDCLYECNCV